jgi:hypothetical protein
MNISEVFMPDNISFAGLEIIDVPNFLEFMLRFSLNTGVIIILIRWLYYSTTKRKDYLFTYILISTIVFLLCFLLESVKLQIGFALGLFAIFGIIRYRTSSMPIKEMTYLFMAIGISVINALTSTKTSLADLLFTNGVLILMTYGLEKVWLLKHEASKIILYEKINLIKPENYNDLLKDLIERTGIKTINRIETGKIDFLKDTCTLTIFYDSKEIETTEGIQNENGDDDE